MKYYLIHNGDGDTYVSEYDHDKLLEEIEEGSWGENPPVLDRVPDRDTNYWGEGILIIKGEIATLKKKEVVTKYDLD